MKRKMLSICLAALMLLSQIPFTAMALTEDFDDGYAAGTAITASTTPWSTKTFTPVTAFSAAIAEFDGDHALEVKVNGSAGTHQGVYHTFSDTAVTGVVEYEYNIYFPTGGSSTIWLGLNDGGRADVVAYRFSVSSTAISVAHMTGHGTTTATTLGTLPLDQWITVRTVMDGSSMKYRSTISCGDTVISDGKTWYDCWNQTGYTAPEGARFYMQKNGSYAHFYIDDVNYAVYSYAEAAEADAAALTLASTEWSGDQSLPTVGSIYDSAVSWASSDLSVITVDSEGNAAVTPAMADTNVTLTATLTKGDASATKSFTVKVKGIASSALSYKDDFSGYAEDTALGTSATDSMPYYITSNRSEFSASVEKLSDSNQVLAVKMGNHTYDATLDGAHHYVYRHLTTTALGSGLVEYKVNLFFPTGVDNGEGGTYNTATNNAWVSLYDSVNSGSRKTEVVSVSFQRSSGSNLSVTSVHGTPGSSGESTQALGTVPMDTWVTLRILFDGSAMTYIPEVSYGSVKTTGKEQGARNYGRTGIDTDCTLTVPETLVYYYERTRGATSTLRSNQLFYVDNMDFTYLTDEDIVKLEAASLTIPEGEWIEDQSLPAAGSLYGSAVTWTSSSSAVTVDASGKAAVAPAETDTAVTLTATVTRGTATAAKTFTVTVKSLDYIKTVRLTNILDKLTFASLSGQKENYLSADFTPVIADLPADVTATYTSGNPDVLTVGDTITLNRQAEDVFTTLTVKLSDGTYEEEKTFTVMVQGEGIVIAHEGFDDTALLGQSVSAVSGWSGGGSDEDTAGVYTSVAASPDDTAEQVLDVHKLRKASGNEYAAWTMSDPVVGQTVLEADMKVTGSTAARYILYAYGNYITDGTKTGSGSAQLNMDWSTSTRGGKLWAQAGDGGEGTGYLCYSDLAFPMNEWFHLRLIINQAEKTVDVYVDDVKYNTGPIPFFGSPVCDSVQFTSVQIGSARQEEVDGHLYIDDMQVRVLESDEMLLENEKKGLSIPTETMFDLVLPTAAAYGSPVTWKSHNTAIVADDGTLTRAAGMGTDTVTLTATVTRGDAAATRDFAVKVYRQPVYTIDTITYADSEGNLSYTPAAGRTIKSLSVTGYGGTGAEDKIYLAVYQDGELTDVKLLDPASDMSNLNIALPTEGTPDVKVFAWNGVEPMTYDFESDAAKKEKKTKIFVCGDSTGADTGASVTTPDSTRQYGWAMLLQGLFDENYVTVENHAVGGRSTKSFFDELRLHKVVEELEAGDYMIVQFGHNDQKTNEPHNYTTLGEDGTFRQYLTTYVNAARSKGAIPVFATSIYRRQFNGTTAADSFGGYPQEMLALAAELDVPVLDMHARSGEWLTEIGYDASAAYYMVSVNGSDNTHFTYTGALHFATMATEEMERIGLPITAYLK